MSYFRDLDEYTDDELIAEGKRRIKLRFEGKCDYCKRPHGCEPSCKFPDRHNMTLDREADWTKPWINPDGTTNFGRF